MSTYVMSDIHGCYDDMRKMLKQINFSDADTLVLAGDCIDRGPQSFEMLNWMKNHPDNVIFLMGNHEFEFAYEIRLMEELCKKNKMSEASMADTQSVFAYIKHESGGVFDYYGTIQELIEVFEITLKDLLEYTQLIEELPYFYKLQVGAKNCVIVHAGYVEDLPAAKTARQYDCLDEFYLYARDDAYTHGGIAHGIIVAGHTPTISENELTYNNGDVYVCYDEKLDCIFYDIDCGCFAKEIYENAKLACIRLDNEKIFYV